MVIDLLTRSKLHHRIGKWRRSFAENKAQKFFAELVVVFEAAKRRRIRSSEEDISSRAR